MRRYSDRVEAGRELAARLGHLAGQDCVVLGAPRGGVVVAARIAEALDAPLDVVLVRKLPLPFARETAFGVLTEQGEAILDQSLVAYAQLDPETVERTKDEVMEVLRRQRETYRAVRPAEPLADRSVLLVDDGLATGYTMLGAVRWAQGQRPARVVLAAPVASDTAESLLKPNVDEFVCPIVDPGFLGVSAYYENFEQVDDETVTELLQTHR